MKLNKKSVDGIITGLRWIAVVEFIKSQGFEFEFVPNSFNKKDNSFLLKFCPTKKQKVKNK